MQKILIIDDEPDVLEFISYNLKKEGFDVYTAINGKEGLKKAKEINPHLIILDVMMPEMDGVETCRELRKTESLGNTIIVFLSARSEDYSQITGLEAGADDYITKPIKVNLLVSKIKSLTRRLEIIENKGIQVVGVLVINLEQHLITYKGEDYDLPKKEFELLSLLASKPNKVFSRNEIFTKIWGNDVVVGDRTIDVHIRKIRKRTSIDSIKTLKGVGYKFEL